MTEQAVDEKRREDESARRPRRNWILVLAGVVAVAVIAFCGWRWWESGHYARTEDAYVGGDMVPVLSRASGYVQRVEVRENDRRIAPAEVSW